MYSFHKADRYSPFLQSNVSKRKLKKNGAAASFLQLSADQKHKTYVSLSMNHVATRTSSDSVLSTAVAVEMKDDRSGIDSFSSFLNQPSDWSDSDPDRTLVFTNTSLFFDQLPIKSITACSSMWSNTSERYIDKIQLIQNYAARIMCMGC